MIGYRNVVWQDWPITIVTGAYLGHAVGRYVGMSVLKGVVLAGKPHEE